MHSDGDLPLISVLPWSREGDAVSRVGEMIGIPPTGDTPELTLAHEVGHQLDWLLRDEHGTDMTDLKAVIADTTQFRAIRAWLQEAHDALQETPDEAVHAGPERPAPAVAVRGLLAADLEVRYPVPVAGMADQEQDYIDSDYSGRPYRLPTVDEILSGPPTDPLSLYDLGFDLPDGRSATMADGGQYYIDGDDGRPDLDRPVWIEGLSTGEPSPEDEVIDLPRPDDDRT